MGSDRMWKEFPLVHIQEVYSHPFIVMLEGRFKLLPSPFFLPCCNWKDCDSFGVLNIATRKCLRPSLFLRFSYSFQEVPELLQFSLWCSRIFLTLVDSFQVFHFILVFVFFFTLFVFLDTPFGHVSSLSFFFDIVHVFKDAFF